MAVIQSLLDQDLYKLTMMQTVLHQFPEAQVRYRFKCRNQAVLSPFIYEIEQEIKHLCTLRYTEDELEYLAKMSFFKSDFIDFLRLVQLDMRYVKITAQGDEIDIRIEGPWLQTIQFEVFVLAIVQEVYSRNVYADVDVKEGQKRLADKIAFVKQSPEKEDLVFADFGTRRRFSREWQEYVVQTLCENFGKETFMGSSNMYLAYKYDLKAIGTMAHEYLQAGQALGPSLKLSQKFMLEKWVQEYRGELGIALSDVVGFKAFRKDFDLYFSKLYDGCRHDSGDPIEWCKDLITHYESMGIDAKTKRAVFSDGLNFEKALEIMKLFKDQIQVSFGIGTNLSNDLGVKPLQIVMKIVECNGEPVAKISDSPGKGMCESAEYMSYLKKVFNIEE
jgi:nicotinate phosphoribosyltransferase